MPDTETFARGFWYQVRAQNEGNKEDPIWRVETSGADDPAWAAWTVMSMIVMGRIDATNMQDGSMFIEGAML